MLTPGPLELSVPHHSATCTMLYKTRHLPFLLLVFSSQQFGLQALSLGALIEGKLFLKRLKKNEKFPVEYLLFSSSPPCCLVEAFREREGKKKKKRGGFPLVLVENYNIGTERDKYLDILSA